jgi:hypothetical protein
MRKKYEDLQQYMTFVYPGAGGNFNATTRARSRVTMIDHIAIYDPYISLPVIGGSGFIKKIY